MFAFAFLLLLSTPLGAQIPPSEHLSPQDEKEFRAEIDRLNSLLAVSSDKCTVMYQIARTWAAGGQYAEAIDWLNKVLRAGFDPTRDPLFEKLRGAREFESLVQLGRQFTPPVSHSMMGFRLPASDQFPENLAYDRESDRFYFGSTYNNRIVRCSTAGRCESFATGTGIVLGLKIDAGRRILWAASNRRLQSAMLCYRLDSGALVRQCALNGSGHMLNDLALGPAGDIYVTDTAAAAAYHLRPGTSAFERLAPAKEFPAANGIALSARGEKLYISDFGDGISVMDLSSGSVHAIAHPSNVCLGYVDGLYFYKDSLIAIQNGFMSPRVVRFSLTPDRNGISEMKVLERRNPLFDGVTTGVIVGPRFFYMANNQIDKVRNGKVDPSARLDPITILRIDLNQIPPRPNLPAMTQPIARRGGSAP